ncbi:MAG: TIGR03960 family B12-binding radical SAM protein [Candidatus Caldatribacteriota bacterium]
MEKSWLEKMLDQVEKPGRYMGKEFNQIVKKDQAGMIKIALAFPDLYEIGMSYLGFKILYHILNQRKDVFAERVFSPAVDLERLLRAEKLPVFSLETYRPLNNFDIVGFTIQHELCFTNILNLLELGHIPLKAEDRDENSPLIIAGGPGTFNPEPLVDFIDAFVIGEGEEVILEIMKNYKQWKRQQGKKDELLLKLARIKGLYVPYFYRVEYKEDGRIKAITPTKKGVLSQIKKRIIKDFNQASYPIKPIVPNLEVVHDRITLEILRGCTRGCRFCQAGMIYRPVRERSLIRLLEFAEETLKNTGYEEISLSSLSSTDYSQIEELIRKMVDHFGGKGVGVSLPSLRIDTFSVNLAQQIQRVRKVGLTFAPEVGTERLRRVINKNVSEEDLFSSLEAAFQAGWRRVKLYFMVGLPTETDEDIDGIVKLVKKVKSLGRKIAGKKMEINVSISVFVPKAHTPFQWEAQEKMEVLEQKLGFLSSQLKERHILFNYSDVQRSFLEAIFARGDRRLGKVLEKAHQLGCKFDSWQEHFNFENWQKAFRDNQISMEFYATRERQKDEIFPWEHISTGVKREYLWQEREKARIEESTPDCRFESCTNCGVCEEG